MKAFNTIMKLLAALAAVAGAVYVVATYGDKIVAWAKKLWVTLPQCPGAEESTEAEVVAEAPAAEETPAVEEAPAEEAPAEAPAAEEAPAEEPAPQIAENDPVADDADFAE